MFVANIIALSVGTSIGWTSPFLPKLQSNDEDSPLSSPLTSDEASWVGSIFAVGALCGTVLFGFISGIFHEKSYQNLFIYGFSS
jgi:MFS family permease